MINFVPTPSQLKKASLLLLLVSMLACSSSSKVNNTVGGAALGGIWGAGAGAVVGNQLAPARAGEGLAVGMAFGAISGAAQGAGFDSVENELEVQADKLDSLTIQNKANRQLITNLQDQLDNQDATKMSSLVYQVFFESDATNLKFGSIKNLEKIADQISISSRVDQVIVNGHSDQTGNQEYNQKLALARAKSVAAYIMGRGISQDQITINSFGAKEPVATNQTAEGRQLNRRVDVSIQLN